MKIDAWCLVFVFLSLSAVPAFSDCTPPDVWEDDDSLETAHLVYMFPAEMNLNIGWEDDDYSHYYITKDVIISVSIYFQNSLGDIDIQLLDAQGAMLVQSNSAGDSESIVWQAPANTEVYLRVFLYSGQCNAYTLYVDYDFSQACLDDPYEENDQMESASPVSMPVLIGNLVSQYLDEDFYAVTVVPGMKLDIQCLFANSQGDIDLYLWGDDMSVLGSSSGVGADLERIVWTSDRNGEVFVFVHMFTPDGCNGYSLSIDGCPAPQVYIEMAPCEHYLGAYMLSGTASHTALQSWTLDYTGGMLHRWVPIASGTTSIVDDVLATWDATFLEPCAYTLRLRAVGSCPDSPLEAEYLVSFTLGIPGDLDRDGDVDIEDFGQFASVWLMTFP